jgi:hypothetical protein
LNPDGVGYSIPLAPVAAAELAVGQHITQEIFRLGANGKVPVELDCLGQRRAPWAEWFLLEGRRRRYLEMRDDYHGGW